MSPTEPLDDTLSMSIRARDEIRRHVMILRENINRWEPRPCPPKPSRGRQ
jgi:hypothetical protein